MKLSQHNKDAYKAVEKMLKNSNRSCVINATGTGKSFIAYQIIDRHPKSKILFITSLLPNAIKFVENGNNEGINMSNVTSTIYSSIKKLEDYTGFDYIICDEFHRMGATTWQKYANKLIVANGNAKIIGFTATPIRYLDHCRNMVDEVFGGADGIAYSLPLEAAIAKGILPRPEYISVMYSIKIWNDRLNKMEQINSRDFTGTEARKIQALNAIRRAKKMVSECPTVNDIIKERLIKKDGHYFVFCSRIEEIVKLKKEAKNWFKDVNDITCYEVHSGIVNSIDQLNAFLDDTSSKAKLLFCVDMLTEGIHSNSIDGAFFLRNTVSPIKFFQQLGRTLSTGKGSVPQIFDLVGSFGCLKAIERKMEQENIDIDVKEYDGNGTLRELEIPFEFEITDYILNIEKELNYAEQLIKQQYEVNVGDTRTMNNGKVAKVIACKNKKSIDVLFLEEGIVVKNRRCSDFLKGRIDIPLEHRKAKRIGEEKVMNCGLKAKIIEYRNSHDIDVEFENGKIHKHSNYYNFSIGAIFPDGVYRSRAKNLKYGNPRLGEERLMNCGLKAKIIEYKNSTDITVQFENGKIVEHRVYQSFLLGRIGTGEDNRGIKQSSRLGEERMMNNGLLAKIIKYKNTGDIDVEFENGTIVYHKRYRNFLKGEIGARENTDYNYNMESIKKITRSDRIGETKIMNNGMKAKITNYKNSRDIDVMFENGQIAYHKSYDNFKIGNIGLPRI